MHGRSYTKPISGQSFVYLVVKFEECIVDDQVVALEPLEQVADDGQPVDHSRRHGGALLLSRLPIQPQPQLQPQIWFHSAFKALTPLPCPPFPLLTNLK